MKKTYMNPAMQVVTFSSNAQLMAGSLDPENNRGSVFEKSVDNGVAGEARGFDFEDED